MFSKMSKEVEEEMEGLIVGQGCMRKVIDDAMDGAKERLGCEEDEVACQRCRGAERGRGLRGEELAVDRVEFEQQKVERR